MAGTRLVIQATLLVELLVLIGIAAYFGLCRNNDVLCTPLFGQEGRSLIVIPPQWQTMHVFENNGKESESLRRYNLHVTLVLEDGSDWTEWARDLDIVLLQSKLIEHPCLVGVIETDISLKGNLSDNSRAVVNDQNATEYRISGSTVKKWLTSRRNHFDDYRLDILLYVPVKAKKPLYVKLRDMKPATALTWKQQLLTIVERQDDTSNKLVVENALAYANPFLQEQCYLSSNSTEWWQQLVHDTYERAKDSVTINHNIMTKASLKVPITSEVRSCVFYTLFVAVLASGMIALKSNGVILSSLSIGGTAVEKVTGTCGSWGSARRRRRFRGCRRNLGGVSRRVAIITGRPHTHGANRYAE